MAADIEFMITKYFMTYFINVSFCTVPVGSTIYTDLYLAIYIFLAWGLFLTTQGAFKPKEGHETQFCKLHLIGAKSW